MAKKSGSTKKVIQARLKSKIQELLNQKELDMVLERRNLGLEPKGDMADFVKDLVKKLKKK
jgi:hypothetical protein